MKKHCFVRIKNESGWFGINSCSKYMFGIHVTEHGLLTHKI